MVESAMSPVLFTLWLSILLLTLICPPLMDPSMLGPSPVFYIFALLSLASTIFVGMCIKETMGLSDKEKKHLYMPIEYQNDQDEEYEKETNEALIEL